MAFLGSPPESEASDGEAGDAPAPPAQTGAGSSERSHERAAAAAVGRLQSATLPPIGSHLVWVVDAIFLHAQLFDGDTGAMYATIDSGTTISPKPPLYSRARGEFYSVEIDYDRGRRGKRTDFVTIYDDHTLDVKGDIVFPTRAGESATSLAYTALLDGERFLAVFNQFPVTSVSIIDLERRTFAGQVPTAGCAGIYPAGPRAWAMLCGNGTVHVFRVDESGRPAGDVASAPFFDPVEDPAMLAAGRIGDTWYYPTFSGRIHAVDLSAVAGGGLPRVDSWSLVDDADRAAGWRPGGRQLMAANAPTGRLYVLFHRGGPGTHKDPGPELWVFDAARRERVARIELPNLTAAFLVDMLQIGPEGFVPWLLDTLIPREGADTVSVSKDAAPLVFVRHSERGAVAVLDGMTGEHLRNLSQVGLGGTRLETP
jgi:methylamine dehydrogenase heavy chain